MNTYDFKRTITRTKYRNQQNTNYLKNGATSKLFEAIHVTFR